MKTIEREVSRIVPVVPTPFRSDEAIDEEALRRLIEFAVDIGVRAVCLPAYGSEFYKLSDKERIRIVQVVVQQAAGRLLVIAQSNHPSSHMALSIAKANVDCGADLVSIALPRQFALPDDDLLRYLAPVLNGVNVPCLVQDFNPGGPTIGVDFVQRLRSECSNFRFLKLEAPLLAGTVHEIREITGDQIGILAGWGGLYMLELMKVGIRGVMPGLALADLLSWVFDLQKEARVDEAFDLYSRVLPQIVFSLQNLELYQYCEKCLLKARGLLPNARCRSGNYTPDSFTADHIDYLNRQVMTAVEQSRYRSRVK